MGLTSLTATVAATAKQQQQLKLPPARVCVHMPIFALSSSSFCLYAIPSSSSWY